MLEKLASEWWNSRWFPSSLYFSIFFSVASMVIYNQNHKETYII